jgi:hypothetical protein
MMTKRLFDEIPPSKEWAINYRGMVMAASLPLEGCTIFSVKCYER